MAAVLCQLHIGPCAVLTLNVELYGMCPRGVLTRVGAVLNRAFLKHSVRVPVDGVLSLKSIER